MPANYISKKSMRNLAQYKDLPEDVFEKIWELKNEQRSKRKDTDLYLEKQMAHKLLEFEKDYDIDDLNANDKEILYSMIKAMINLEELDRQAGLLTMKGVDQNNLNLLDKITSMASKLRNDISSMQDDLKITRKARKSGKEESVAEYIDNLKKKAKEYHKSRSFYIFCPKCNMLAGTVWLNNFNDPKATIRLTCPRKDTEGNTCGEKIVVKFSDYKNKKTNKEELLPDTMK